MKETNFIGGLEDEFPEFPDRIVTRDMAEKLVDFAEWIVSLDDDDPESPGRQERRTITLTKIIEKAREALP